MKRQLAILVALVFATGACVTGYGEAAPGSDESAATGKKKKSSKEEDPSGSAAVDRSGDVAPPDRSGGGTGPTTPVQPAPGSGGPVQQAAQKFPGSKAFLPQQLPAPGLLMLHGSEGGSDGTIEEDAAVWAQAGFVVVTLCWFNCPGLPDKIVRIPLDRTVEAGTWLASTVEVGGKKTALFGWSRGGEQAVLVASLLASTTPFAAVAVHAPSDTVVSSYDPATDNGVIENGTVAPAWTFHGEPLFGERSLDDNAAPGPRIEIEKYPGPLFVSHGMNDTLWEVARSQRLVASRSRVPGLVTEAHFWPGEDHMIESQATQDQYDAAFTSFLSREVGR